MDRRLAGAAVLLVALLCAVALPRLTSPGLAGSARLDPGLPPPTVGTCVLDAVSPTFDVGGWMYPLPDLRSVDCESPHWGEIVLVETFDPLAEQAGERRAECWHRSAGRAYLTGRPAAADWTTAMSYDVTALGPDAQQFAGGQRWLACVVRGAEPFTGSLAGVAADGNPPPTLGLCYETDHASFDARRTDCRMPHSSEVFAYLGIDVQRPPEPAAVDSWCRDRADAAAGGRNLADEPGLLVAAAVFVWFDDRQSRFVPLPLPADADGATAICGVRVVGDRSLTASLRRIGDAPLPWAE